MEQNLLQQGLELMLFGMGTVFVFLVLLIFCTVAMSRVVLRFSPDEAQPIAPAQTLAPTVGEPDERQRRLIAAISVAVHRYRTRRRD